MSNKSIAANQETHSQSDGIIKIKLTGYDLLNNSRLNKGTAFYGKRKGCVRLGGEAPLATRSAAMGGLRRHQRGTVSGALSEPALHL